MNMPVKRATSVIALCLLAACGKEPVSPAASTVEQALSGNWHVAGVAVPDTGVQALADDDPQVMGWRLRFSHDRLEADKRQGLVDDTCTQPTFQAVASTSDADTTAQLRKLGVDQATAYSVICKSGSWGPSDADTATFFKGVDGTLALRWYDNGMFKLVRD
ncbi:hypothetical protein [Pseudomonas sp.]|uniref:hypothetical protein n=1 Tax=Pseudomonas sp. TaxID=306 RepID=UPI0028A9F87E|nr:hypothetical protein [Pseudomonas sp.]